MALNQAETFEWLRNRVQELEERIRTLESACEAARKLFVGLVPELGRAEDVEAMIKRLEGAIKHG